jgi:hypothetical protein
METQVNVSSAGGEPIEGRRNTWTNGVDTWHHIRVPKDADSKPHFRDYQLAWPLDPYVEAIGSTGWDWQAKRSRWVGFDFDAITGHAAGVGIAAEELDRIREAAMSISYVETRRSTGGGGLHLYVLCDVPTENHTEHAALARAVLAEMSSQAGFDFAARIDACGGNMWIWHRKMTTENRGLELLEAADWPLSEDDLPENWRDHLDVVTRKRSKVRIRGVVESVADEFDILSSSWKRTPLDEQHREHIEWLCGQPYSTVWLPDHHLLQTHTAALKRLHAEKNLLGLFETATRESTPMNCFAFPYPNGAWKVYRFGNAAEAPTWTRDEKTWCWFNRPADPMTVVRSYGNLDGEKNEWVVKPERAATVLAAIPDETGVAITLPTFNPPRPIRFRERSGTLVLKVPRNRDETAPDGWVESGKFFTRTIQIESPEADDRDADNQVRALVTPQGEMAGYLIRSDRQTWDRQPCGNVKMYLQSLGETKDKAERLMGAAIRKRWELVSLPFQPEFPGNRRWNLGAAQFRVQPATERDLPHSHWDRILEHAGAGLTPAIKRLDWPSIRTGADYLRCYLACMFREPFEPLPFLFLYGPENSGKSIVWEGCELLVTRGVVKADRTLTNQSDFNGELANAILCVIEEKNIAATPGALNRIKDYVTAKTLSIRRMKTDTYAQPNCTHWMQFSNDPAACPVFAGDTRITMVEVGPLATGSEIPKALLLKRLEDEAPAFLRTLLDLDLPPLSGRLRLPVVETAQKQAAQERSRPPVERFINARCRFDDPEAITSKRAIRDAFNEFVGWERGVDNESRSEVSAWGRQFVSACGARLPKQAADLRTTDREHAFRGVKLSDLADLPTSALAV